MPRLAASGARPDWNRLYELASGQAGYFTLADAAQAGFSPPLVQHHLKVGRVGRSGKGVLRLVNFPPGDEEDLVPVWLWSNKAGVFSHETALVIHGMSDALPSKKHLTVPASWSKRRLRVPEGVVLHYSDLGKADVAWKGPVQVTTPLRTIQDCTTDAVAPDLVRQAVTQGVRRGLFSRDDIVEGRRIDADRTSDAAAFTEHHGLSEAARITPTGIVCLLSALGFHGMTTQSPHKVWLAIDVKARKPKADWPPIRIVRFSGRARTSGVEKHVIEGVDVLITSKAKTVADCFKYRNKIGIDVAVEALRDYLRRRGRSMDDLLRAAEVCRVARVMKPYIEALS